MSSRDSSFIVDFFLKSFFRSFIGYSLWAEDYKNKCCVWYNEIPMVFYNYINIEIYYNFIRFYYRSLLWQANRSLRVLCGFLYLG